MADKNEPMHCGKKTLTFTVLGETVGQGRPRFSTHGGFVKAYDPKKSREYKTFVKMLAIQAMGEQGWGYCEKEALKLTVTAYMSIPKSKSGKFREAAIAKLVFPIKKPDSSNIVKGIEDAMNGVVYKDDSQIVELVVKKYYGDVPMVEVEIEYAT